GERIRVGYVSSHFRGHTISKLFLGWVRNHNQADFEVYTYYTGDLVDQFTEQWRHNSDRFHHIPALESVCTQVVADQLHVLVFTDVGMDPQMAQMVGLRLAPVQCAAWGHPVTTGLPTVDYFLTSDEMEPGDAQRYYLERLVRLPKISICYPRPEVPERTRDRRDFRLRDDAVIYLSCQSLFKYLPQFDGIFPAIAQRVPHSQFAFISHPGTGTTATFRERLKRAFALVGLESEDYCILLTQQTQEEYFNLNLIADIFLDTLGWSGGNTTLEALACGLPVVTCPGAFMRGCHASAMLRVLGIDETIARDENAYIDIAVRLGQDPSWREQVIRETHQRLDRLFEEPTCVAALEEFYRQAVLG
ncbi:MAG: glycosyltransferase, partial [Gemmatimonadaceae bacterium]|nr:glycosyltransferase [Gloeobacterales cyanobacterium ES-bin-141]